MSSERPQWAPEGIDLERPNAARVYDYLLGGAANFAADREFAHQLLKIAPEAGAAVRLNRAFLRRAVKFCLDNGIRQFLDIGSGIPTAGNVHEIVQRIDPSARVLYVDSEAVAVTHTEAMLADNEYVDVIQGNLLDPEPVLAAAGQLLDLDEPVGVLMVAVLHFLSDDTNPQAAVAQYVDAMAPGSYLALSHAAAQEATRESDGWDLYKKSSTPALGRTREQLAEFLTGLDLVEPGLVWTPQWHPDTPEEGDPEMARILCAVAQKP